MTNQSPFKIDVKRVAILIWNARNGRFISESNHYLKLRFYKILLLHTFLLLYTIVTFDSLRPRSHDDKAQDQYGLAASFIFWVINSGCSSSSTLFDHHVQSQAPGNVVLFVIKIRRGRFRMKKQNVVRRKPRVIEVEILRLEWKGGHETDRVVIKIRRGKFRMKKNRKLLDEGVIEVEVRLEWKNRKLLDERVIEVEVRLEWKGGHETDRLVIKIRRGKFRMKKTENC